MGRKEKERAAEALPAQCLEGPEGLLTINPGASFLCKQSHLFVLFPPSQFQARPQETGFVEAGEVGLEKTS